MKATPKITQDICGYCGRVFSASVYGDEFMVACIVHEKECHRFVLSSPLLAVGDYARFQLPPEQTAQGEFELWHVLEVMQDEYLQTYLYKCVLVDPVTLQNSNVLTVQDQAALMSRYPETALATLFTEEDRAFAASRGFERELNAKLELAAQEDED